MNLLTEKVGFEPTAPCGVTGFQDQLLKPLGHLSMHVALIFYHIFLSVSRTILTFLKSFSISIFKFLFSAHAT